MPWIGYLAERAAQAGGADIQGEVRGIREPTTIRKQMPLGGRAGIEFPYVEGLRLDEAMHPLALLCVGMYGETLPNQNGAPVRMVVPWKYGFKSIKSIVKIKLVEQQPPTTWNIRMPANTASTPT